jgi:hypothetical protein
MLGRRLQHVQLLSFIELSLRIIAEESVLRLAASCKDSLMNELKPAELLFSVCSDFFITDTQSRRKTL